MVRESLTEIFAEIQLESIVEGVINKTKTNPKTHKRSLSEIYNQPEEEEMSKPTLIRESKTSIEDRKEKAKRMLGITDDTWNEVYANIKPNNPVLTGATETTVELAPESVLKEKGLLRDYSHLL